MKRWIDGLRSGDKVANLYRSELDQGRVLLDVIRWMSDQDELVYLTDDWENPVFRHAIIDAAIDEGRLRVFPSYDTLSIARGFDSETFLHFILNAISRSRDSGYNHMIMMCEINWASSTDSWPQLVEFISLLDLVKLPGCPTIIMQYSTNVYSDKQIDTIHRVNQLVLEAGTLTRNFWIVSKPSPDGILANAIKSPADRINRLINDHSPG